MKVIKVKSARTPIYRDTGFLMEDIPAMKQAFLDELEHPRDPELYIYSRYRNPNVVSTEEEMMRIEEAAWSLLTQSGLSAIDTALSIFQESKTPAKWLFFSEIYGGTNSYIKQILEKRRGVEIVRFTPENDSYSIHDFEKVVLKNKPDLVFFEAISNPMLIVTDGDEMIRIAKKEGAKVVVDNTFATPYLWKPLASGADIVVHSVTKYLAGHGNLSAGVLSGNNPELGKTAIEYRKLVGHMLSPDDAYRLLDMLYTFPLRFEKHCDNAFAVSNFLNTNENVEKVLYPGLKTHQTHSVAKKLFQERGYGAIVTFDIKGIDNNHKTKRTAQLIKNLSSAIPLIPTLGDVNTILMPIEPVWGDRYPFPGMIRLSVGIENQTDLIKTLKEALGNI